MMMMIVFGGMWMNVGLRKGVWEQVQEEVIVVVVCVPEYVWWCRKRCGCLCEM